jgi:oligosaccharide repeat unit polymerase
MKNVNILLTQSSIIFIAAFSYFILDLVDFYNVISIIIVVLIANKQYLFSLRNVFISYTWLVFEFAGRGYYFPQSMDIYYDFLIYSSIFGCGAVLVSVVRNSKETSHTEKYFLLKDIDTKKYEKILKVLTLLKIFILILTISNTGIQNFYSGYTLADKIENYSQGGIGEALEVVLNSFESTISMSAICLYTSSCIIQKKNINYGLLTFFLIGLPILSLKRSTILFGVFTLGIISWLHGSKKIYVMTITLGIILSIISGIFIGNIRSESLSNQSSNLSWQTFIYEEFSPIVAYSEIKRMAEIDGYTFGSTIIYPLIYKPIPRSLMPDKPLNSSATYGYKYDPDSANKGFFMAPTIYGDIFLNFGYIGCILFCFLSGITLENFDIMILKERKYFYLPLYIMLFYNFYSIMRNNISDSLFSIMLSIILVILACEREKNKKSTKISN